MAQAAMPPGGYPVKHRSAPALSLGLAGELITAELDFGEPIAAGEQGQATTTFAGATPGDVVLVAPGDNGDLASFFAFVSGNDTVVINSIARDAGDLTAVVLRLYLLRT